MAKVRAQAGFGDISDGDTLSVHLEVSSTGEDAVRAELARNIFLYDVEKEGLEGLDVEVDYNISGTLSLHYDADQLEGIFESEDDVDRNSILDNFEEDFLGAATKGVVVGEAAFEFEVNDYNAE